MKTKVHQRLQELSNEVENLHAERQAMMHRNDEIQVRVHQLVGAIFELQQLTVDQDRPLSEQNPLNPSAGQDLSTPPSEDGDQGKHQEQPTETEKNNQPQS